MGVPLLSGREVGKGVPGVDGGFLPSEINGFPLTNPLKPRFFMDKHNL